jgi:hypothetical protein
MDLSKDYEDFEIKVRHYQCDDVYIKHACMRFKGVKLAGHSHETDHLSTLIKGSVTVTADGRTEKYTVRQGECPVGIRIAAGVPHEIVSEEDGTVWLCIHQVPESLQVPEQIDQALIKG